MYVAPLTTRPDELVPAATISRLIAFSTPAFTPASIAAVSSACLRELRRDRMGMAKVVPSLKGTETYPMGKLSGS
jgi:hypothetical protein